MAMIASVAAQALIDSLKTLDETQIEGEVDETTKDTYMLQVYTKIFEQIIEMMKLADILGTDHSTVHSNQKIIA